MAFLSASLPGWPIFHRILAGDDVRLALGVERVYAQPQDARLLFHDAVHQRLRRRDARRVVNHRVAKITHCIGLRPKPDLAFVASCCPASGGISRRSSNRQVIWLPWHSHGERVPDAIGDVERRADRGRREGRPPLCRSAHCGRGRWRGGRKNSTHFDNGKQCPPSAPPHRQRF